MQLLATWNCRIWDYERPDDFYAQATQSAKSVTVFGAMARGYLFGPYFFASTVTGDSYRAILAEFLIPDLLERLDVDFEEVWFQQDGAPAHVSNETKAFLVQTFLTRVISRDFIHDLTPCDYYLWGVVKEMVYRDRIIHSVSELQDAVIQAFNVIRTDKMDHVNRAMQAIRSRMQKCVLLNGSQLPHC